MTAVRQKNAPQVALVTGGDRPLGHAIALGLAAQGWDLVIVQDAASLLTDAEPGAAAIAAPTCDAAPAANPVVARIEALGRRAILLDCVLEDADAMSGLVGRAIAGFGRVDCLVNAATIFVPDTIKDFTDDLLARHMRINVQAPLLLARALHAATPAGAQAVVINLIGRQTGQPAPDAMSHSLSAAALQAATRMLAQTLAPTVRVLGVAAGGMMSPEDVAGTVCFLARASALTGHVLLVDGGQHLQPSSNTPMHAAT